MFAVMQDEAQGNQLKEKVRKFIAPQLLEGQLLY
jgi:hypothetical protein